MAEAVFFTSKRTLECSICLQMYNLTDRIPKNLKCGHSFCKSCVDNLNHNSLIKCPKDRTESSADDLVTNFGITDILDTLCEDCNSQEKILKCYHCEQTICTKCLEKHAPSYHGDLRSKLDALQEHITSASDASNDVFFLEFEETKAQNAIRQIRLAIKTRRDALDQIEKDLEDEVKRAMKHNSEQCVKWKKGLEEQLKDAKQFKRQSTQTLGATYTPDCTMEIMHNIHVEYNTVSAGVLDSEDSQPPVTDYSFVETTDLSKLKPGDIVLSGPPEPVALYKVPKPSGQPADIYRTARFKCMTGSQGSGPEEFDTPLFVASMDDRIIITDKDNYRIKIYDHNLHLLHLHGTRGGNPYQSDQPIGVAVNTDNEILVSDNYNNRITVLTKYCNRKYSFGIGRGTKENIHLDGPGAICVDNIGNIYVCEEEQHKVKVMTRDGILLQSIVDTKKMPHISSGKPIHIAVHNDNVFITDTHKDTCTLCVFTKSGQYLESFPKSVPETICKRSTPTGVAVDKHNNIIYADHSGYIVVLNPKGEFVCTIGSPGDKPGQFRRPRGVNITPQGDIVVCDTGNNRVQIFEVENAAYAK